jgi:hypothetical protein
MAHNCTRWQIHTPVPAAATRCNSGPAALIPATFIAIDGDPPFETVNTFNFATGTFVTQGGYRNLALLGLQSFSAV